MSNSKGDEKAGESSWQLEGENEERQPKDPMPTDDREPQSNRKELLEHAKKFLEEDEVKAASLEKKIAFLEGKGLHNSEIHDLLGISRAPSVTEASATFVPPPSSNPISARSQTGTSQTPERSNPRPPIIAYPEFLIKPKHPPPLITKPRLLTTFYLFSGLTLLLHGTKNYLVTPMLASLLEARLSFASTAKANLQKLVERLESSVSVIPPHISHAKRDQELGQSEKEDSDAGDPTELFHRDVGVQTSLPESPVEAPESLSAKPETQQKQKLDNTKTNLSALVESSTSEGQDMEELTTSLNMLREYCDDLAYVPPSTWNYYGAARNQGANGKNENEIDRLKKGIRSVKGVFLSARAFPAANGG